jgi:hypothetical protein
MSKCDAHQFSDMMVCPCGLRWDVNDPEPPPCPHRYPSDYREAVAAARAAGIAVQPLSPREVSQAQRRLARLYSSPAERVWGILDTGGKVFMAAVMILALGIIIGKAL